MGQDKENIISIFNDADVYHKDILSTWDDLFTSIGNKCNNDRECIVEILRFRGFLIDNINDDYYLSDNSHENDIEHLNDILRKYEIGRVDYDNRENFEITIKFNHKINRKNIEALKKSISESPRIGGEASDNDMSWPQFYSREHAYKVPVKTAFHLYQKVRQC